MKALLISAAQQTIEEININTLDDLPDIIGFDSIEADELGDNGDQLYFDEECFIRGTKGRFQIDSLIPVAGKGVILGSDRGQPTDVKVSIEELNGRLKYV